MSKSRMNRNPAKVRPGVNLTRPNGANVIAESSDPRELIYAALECNRATRRLARRNLRKKMRADLARERNGR